MTDLSPVISITCDGATGRWRYTVRFSFFGPVMIEQKDFPSLAEAARDVTARLARWSDRSAA